MYGIVNACGLENVVIPNISIEPSAVSPSSSHDGNIDSESGIECLPCDSNITDKSPDLMFGLRNQEEEVYLSLRVIIQSIVILKRLTYDKKSTFFWFSKMHPFPL